MPRARCAPPTAASLARPLGTPVPAKHGVQLRVRPGAILLAALALALAGCAGVALAVSPGAGSRLAAVVPWIVRDPPLDGFWDAPSWALTNQLERPVQSEALRGRVVLANFVYTTCRETCPLLGARMQAV